MSAIESHTDSCVVLPPGAPRVRLSVDAGGAVRECETIAPVTLIGGRRDCHLVLDEPEVSKVHAAVLNTGTELLLCDLCSRTGTFLNDQLVRVAPLPGDAKIRVGPVHVRHQLLERSEAGPHSNRPLIIHQGKRRIELAPTAAVVGRRLSCHIFVDTPDVSLAHAILLFVSGCPVIYDLGSRSGTFVNGQRVELAWLRDGDKLSIGGEELGLEWAGARPPNVRPAAPVRAAVVSEAAEIQAAPVVADLDDLERTIASLHSYIATSRSELDARGSELEQRETLLKESAAELDRRRAALEKLDAELRERSGDLEKRDAEVRARHDQLAAQDVELAARVRLAREHETALEKRRGELAEQAAALQADLGRLESERKALAEQIAEHDDTRAALARREEECAAFAAALAEREKTVSQREATIAAREAADQEAAQKIEQFKSALREASLSIASTQGAARGRGEATTMAGGPKGAAGDRAAEAPATVARPVGQAQVSAPPTIAVEVRSSAADGNGAADGGRGRVPVTPKPEKSNGHAANGAGTLHGLPAPVVDKPMFGPRVGEPPADWPTELRERFLVLRRTTNRSDDSLIAQVMAEAAAGKGAFAIKNKRGRRAN